MWLQVSILLYAICCDSKIWNLQWGFAVNQTNCLSLRNISYSVVCFTKEWCFGEKLKLWNTLIFRYINRLANISLDPHLRENPTKTHRTNSISPSANTYFQKVLFVVVTFVIFSFSSSSILPLQLSVADVEGLYKIYKKDFLMFGYSPQLYKDAAS